MSYSRGPSVGYWVVNEIEGYVYSNGQEIIDYGSTRNDLIEMLGRYWRTEDTQFKDWLMKRLAKELGVLMREKPLTDDEWFEFRKELDKTLENRYSTVEKKSLNKTNN